MIVTKYQVVIPYAETQTSPRFDAYLRDIDEGSSIMYMAANGVIAITTDREVAEVLDAYSEGRVEEKLDEIGYQGTMSAADNLSVAGMYEKWGMGDHASEYFKRAEESLG